ncbi:MAG: efflux RND transporter periplasmic adaptor subunit [Sphingomonadales bacterium]|nr:efflux RND transporter periplasmic adaptor subunit [Sphingomonadales bacterium]
MHEDSEYPAIERDPRPPRGLAKVGAVAVVAAVVVVIAGMISRSHEENAAQQTSTQQSVPTVHLIMPTPGGSSNALVLPATLEGWYTAHIFARVPGYIRSWFHDIGDRVGAGTPLGAIDTPDLDQQISAARAALERRQAEAVLARTTAARWQDLLKSASVSRQEADEKNADEATHAAAVHEAAANLNRLLALKAYATIRSPFAGEVTLRNADIGDLVGPGTTNQQPLFAVADESRIRVYVDVPQQYAASMKPGLTATLSVPESPGKAIPARVIATSGAVNSRNGAFQVQLVTPNPGDTLKSGGYAQVSFALPPPPGVVTVPSSALVLRGSGTKVATVDASGHVHLLPVVLGRDLGSTVEISSGLSRGTPVIDSPSDSIANGEKVHVEGG